MKKIYLVAIILISNSPIKSQIENWKKGLNLGLLPTFTYDSDLGLQYGALLNLFNYGDGSIYPDFFHMYYLEVSRYTKGSGVYRFMFDSDRLVNGIQITTDLSYVIYDASEFFGFNGYDAVMNQNWTDTNSEYYISRFFYAYRKGIFSFRNDFQGSFRNSRLKWNLGLTVLKFNLGPVDFQKLNKGKDQEEQLEDVDGLYDKYLQWGIITPDDADGGFVNSIKTGIIWDSRDNKPNPMRGIWSEAGFEFAPAFLGTESGFSKFYLIHRQYFTLIDKDLSLVYRLGYQSKLTGEVPFYYQSQLITSFLRGAAEGLGGSKSLRGVLRNRIVGNGIFYGNTELRWKAIYFSLFRQEFYLGINAFLDYGMVTSKINFEIPSQLKMGDDQMGDYFRADSEKMHFSTGAGIRIAMNYNFIVAADFGNALNPQDGKTGLYMGLNYLF